MTEPEATTTPESGPMPAYRMLWGLVSSNGQMQAGGSGSVGATRTANGHYTLQFSPSFSQMPAVTVTQVYPQQANSSGGKTLDNAIIIYVDSGTCLLQTGDDKGNATDRWFSFIAIGYV